MSLITSDHTKIKFRFLCMIGLFIYLFLYFNFLHCTQECFTEKSNQNHGARKPTITYEITHDAAGYHDLLFPRQLSLGYLSYFYVVLNVGYRMERQIKFQSHTYPCL